MPGRIRRVFSNRPYVSPYEGRGEGKYMKKAYEAGCGAVVLALGLGAAAWMLGLRQVVQASVQAGHLADWIMGVLCFFWLLVLLKAPWDLYFQAHRVVFEMQRSKERGIAVIEGREAYVLRLRQKLGLLAIGLHLLSAALAAAVAFRSGGAVGYWFALFFLVSTVFRPLMAVYVYLTHKLRELNREVRYPREDVEELREKVDWQERTLRDLMGQIQQCREMIQQEVQTRDAENRELRQNVFSMSREMETTVSRLTDNQEVIKGIQAFVRLIHQSTRQA